MPTVLKLNPTGHLRFVRVEHSASDESVPTMVCGVHRYKLQQKWLGPEGFVVWQDVPIEHSPL